MEASQSTPRQEAAIPAVGGVSFVSLVAPTEDLYNATLDFYKSLAFVETFVYDRTRPRSHREPDHCLASEKETWLESHREGQDSATVTIKLRLVAARGRPVTSTRYDVQDWRGRGEAVVLYAPKLDPIIKVLQEKKIEFQCQPDEHTPIEVYTQDPLGTLMGFTTKGNAYSKGNADFQVEKRSSLRILPSPMMLPGIKTPPGKQQRLAVMTSGGDAPGMNAAVRAVVRYGISKGCQVYAVYEGYEGLVRGEDYIRRKNWEDVRGWLSEGGTLIGTARCKEFREREGRLKAAKNLILKEIDALIVCGGDGSLTGADLFRSEWRSLLDELVARGELKSDQIVGHDHLVIVGMVGSIDNDMSLTDATIGAYSSLARICQAVDYIDATAYSHSRAFVLEVMGRHCGWLALMAGVSTGADFVFIPEKPPAPGWEEDMCSIIKKHRSLGKRKTIVIVAEGAIDRELQPITAKYVNDVLVEKLRLDTRVTTLGHIQRGGPPCAYDRMLATLQGVEAVQAVLDSTPEIPSPMIAIRENKITREPLVEAVRLTKAVAEAIGRKDFQTAISLRDAEFEEYYRAYIATTRIDVPSIKAPVSESMRIAIIHIGAPAGGMNAATRAAATYCLNRGHKALAIHNGFPGLVRHEAVRELDWLTVDSWAIRGGSEIGTNRSLPSENMGMVAYFFQKHQFDALMIIGGFEAFHALTELYEAREAYPAFRIPMVHLPATISNNVPGTEFSLGSDTCLNALVDYCDAIKQSASASRRRVFVVEVHGGRSGYVATMGGLSVGALAVYTPEEGINLRMLMDDIDHLRESFANDQGMNRAGKLILRNEKSSKTYTTDLIANVIREEAKGRFESRTSIPGHVQQGGTPSPMDRVRAVRLAVKCIQFLEDNFKSPTQILADPCSASVIGIQGASVLFTPISVLASDKETEWNERRPRRAFWLDFKDIVDILSGRKGSFGYKL